MCNNDINLKFFLCNQYDQITSKNISIENDFLDYENFRSFIIKRYNLEHMKIHNYIKYVKVIRQIIQLNDNIKYRSYIDTINSYIKLLSEYNVFPKKNIVKFMYKTDAFIRLIDKKRKILQHTIKNIRDIFDSVNPIENDDTKFKLLHGLNTFSHRCQIFNKYSAKIIHLFKKLILMEESYGIDHKLIDLNNIQRSFLGKTSEYIANKVMKEYIKSCDRLIYYEINIDLLKLLNINFDARAPIKGEIDGIVISFDGIDYIIEYFIEIKSSIKSSFDDINKFVYLQNYIKDMDMTENIVYDQYIFSKNSFKNIFNKNLSDFVMYICINSDKTEVIEKSYLYFSNVLKIIDDNFIKKFYIDKDESVIREKYAIIQENSSLIDKLFDDWKKLISLDDDCNVFVSKRCIF